MFELGGEDEEDIELEELRREGAALDLPRR